jgi:hypothetical protein
MTILTTASIHDYSPLLLNLSVLLVKLYYCRNSRTTSKAKSWCYMITVYKYDACMQCNLLHDLYKTSVEDYSIGNT